MSTAGRINKSGPRFVPKRKTPAAAPSTGSTRASREGSVASSTAGPTPKAGPVALPPVGEDLAEDENELRRSVTDSNAVAASSQQNKATAGTSFKPGASFFGPSDPTASSSLFSTQASTVASTSGSTFGFQPRDPTQSTQATSFGAPTQPPASKSPNAATKNASTLFLPDPATLSSPRPSPVRTSPSGAGASTLSSSPTRGTAFSVSAIPPTLLSPTRRAAELQPHQQDASAEREPTPRLPVPPTTIATASKKRKAATSAAPVDHDDQEEPESDADADEAPATSKRLDKGKQKAGTRPPPAKRPAAAKGKGRANAQADEVSGDDDDDTAPATKAAASKKQEKVAPPATKARPKPRRTASRRASVEAEMQDDQSGQAGADIPVNEPDSTVVPDEADSGESTDEYDRARPKKRVRKRKQPKKGAVDRFLFAADSDDENVRRAGDLRVGGGGVVARQDNEEEQAAGAGVEEAGGPEQDELDQEQEDDEFDDEEEAPVNKRKKRKAPAATKKAAVPRKRKAKGKKVVAAGEQEGDEDANGDGAGPDADAAADGSQAVRTPSPEPLPPVEPDETLMATLADPVPKVQIGRPSERTIFFEERELRLKAERKHLLKLRREKMKRRKQGLPVSDDEEQEGGANGAGAQGEATPAPDDENPEGADGAAADPGEGEGRDLFRLPSLGADEDDDATGQNEGVDMFNGIDAINQFAAAQAEGREVGDEDEDDEDEAGFEETNWAPQMRIVDGQLVLDESSLQVERGNQTQQILNREVVEESAQDRFINSSSYGKRKGGARWSKEETELFYDGLSQFYTNFEMIAIMFPHRSRHEIRRKFNREDKLNPKLVTAALARRKRVDIDAIAKLTGADLSGPVPEDPMDAVNRRRAEIEANGGEIPEPAGGRRRKGKKEEGGHHDEDNAAVLGGSRKRKGKKDAASAAMGYMPGEEEGDGAGGDEDEEDEDVRQVRLEMEEEERQRRIDEMEAAGGAA